MRVTMSIDEEADDARDPDAGGSHCGAGRVREWDAVRAASRVVACASHLYR